MEEKEVEMEIKQMSSRRHQLSSAKNGRRWKMSTALWAISVLLVSLPHLGTCQQVSTARLPFAPSRPDPTCVCDPLCEFIPAATRRTCPLVPRPDCPCCQVCAEVEEGQPCDPRARPCDLASRLECHPEEKVCKGTDTVDTQLLKIWLPQKDDKIE